MNNLKDILIFSNDGINLNVISYDQLNNKEFFPTNEASKEFIKEIMDSTAIRDIKYLDNNRSVVILENGIKIIIDKVSKTLIALQDTALVEKYVEYGKNQNKQRIKEAEHVIIKKANDNKSKIIAGTLAFAIIMTGCVLAEKYKVSRNDMKGLKKPENIYTMEGKTYSTEDFAKIREAELTTNSESIEDIPNATEIKSTTEKTTIIESTTKVPVTTQQETTVKIEPTTQPTMQQTTTFTIPEESSTYHESNYKYTSDPAHGFLVTTGNKTYSVNSYDYNLMCAVVMQEAGSNPNEALAVASVILNRCDNGNWGGTTPYEVITAPNQFSSYEGGLYNKYANGNVPDTVKMAVTDALNGTRNNSYESFRSNGSTYYGNLMITPNGNRFR